MNSAGATVPRSGCCQRSSASTPDEPAVAEVARSAGRRRMNSPRSSARSRSRLQREAAQRPPRACPARRPRSRFLPLLFAVYIATSALRSSSSAVVVAVAAPSRSRCSRGRTSSLPSMHERRLERVEQPPADVDRRARRRPGPRAGSRTRRRRAGRPCRRRGAQPGAASATAISSWSPAPWPRLSLTVLKSSRSRKSTATRSLRALGPRRSRAGGGRGTGRGSRGRSAGRGTPGGCSWSSSDLRAGDVAIVEDDAVDRRVVEQVLRDGLDHEPGAVGVADADLGGDLRGREPSRRRGAAARRPARSSGWIPPRAFRPMRSSARYPRTRSTAELS